jgi:hypothetical protein
MFLPLFHTQQPAPHPSPSYSCSKKLTKNGGYHETVDAGSCCLFNILAHISMQCFKYTLHTDAFPIYVGYVRMLSASQAIEVLILHLIA